MSRQPAVAAYRHCIQRVTDWFVSELTPEGMIRDEPDLIAYYHGPNLLAATGHAVEAHRLATWLHRDALAPDGDFRRQGAKGAIIQPSLQWNYINGWLTWGLARLGRFELSEPAAGYLETFQDDQTGGVPDGGRSASRVRAGARWGGHRLHVCRVARHDLLRALVACQTCRAVSARCTQNAAISCGRVLLSISADW